MIKTLLVASSFKFAMTGMMLFTFFPLFCAADLATHENAKALLAQPQAIDDNSYICPALSQQVDILGNDIKSDAGAEIDLATVDLDLATAGIQQSFMSAEGTFVFDPLTRQLSFTPLAGFNGVATLDYNFMDTEGILSTTGKVRLTTAIPEVDQPPVSQVLCHMAATEAINFTGNVPGIVYNWTNDRPEIGLAESGTGDIPSFAVVNTGNSPITATLSVTPTLGGLCAGGAKIFRITVHPTPNVAQPPNQVLCNGATTNAIAFSGTVDGTIFEWTNDTPLIGIQSSGTGNINSVTAINHSNVPVTATFKVRPRTLSGCAGEWKTFTILVNPDVSISLSSAAGTANQPACVDAPVQPINYRVLNGTGATVSGLPAGLTGQYLDGIFSITGVPSVLGTFVYRVGTVGGCSSAAMTGRIIVRPNVALSLSSDNTTLNQSLCANTSIVPINFTTVNATGATVSGLPSGVSFIYIDGQVTITGNPRLSGNYTYIVRATGLCAASEITGTIQVLQPPAGFNDIVSTLNCSNRTLSYNLQNNVDNTGRGGNGIPAVFSWTAVADDQVTGATDGSGEVITATLINTGSTPKQVVYTVTPTVVAGGCTGNAFNVTVNVPVCNSVVLTKTANVTRVSRAGDQVRYTITVRNNGTAQHANVVVRDPFLGGIVTGKSGDNGNNILEAYETWVYTGFYLVKQQDIDDYGKPQVGSGNLVNTVTFTSSAQSSPLTASATVKIDAKSDITLLKTGLAAADFSTVLYTFTIRNSGKIRLNNLELTDAKLGGNIALSKTVLDAGETLKATVVYQVSNEEKRAGRVVNTALVKAVAVSGEQLEDISGTEDDNDEPTVLVFDYSPRAIDDQAFTVVNQPVTIALSKNDLPVASALDRASIVIRRGPLHGQVTVGMNGEVVYTPDPAFSGADEFTYTIADVSGRVSNVAIVTIQVSSTYFFIPNTITPNGDGKNDTFKIVGRENFDHIELSVMSRWGGEVYRNVNYKDEWDGGGLNEGTYYYILSLKKGSENLVRKGWILIKR